MSDENLNLEGEAESGTPPEGGEGEPKGELVKIGDKEYTVDQLTKSLENSSKYDELLPEFTKKSQLLAIALGNKDPEQEGLPAMLKEGWKPKTFQELSGDIKDLAEYKEKQGKDATEAQVKKTEDAKKQVDSFVEEIKKKDKDFDDKDFFGYIDRHKITVKTPNDLKSVYSTYSEANIDGKAAVRVALANKAKRAADGVSTPSSEGGKLPYDPQKLRTSGLSIVDAAKEALSKFK